ncbi:MAG: hypothetical protein JNK87_09350 [Bryobacterales bacterium]|nr:hypothetical protein [Bryobacterales bacterium]
MRLLWFSLFLGALPAMAQEVPLQKLMLDPQGGVQRLSIDVPRPLAMNDQLVLWSASQRIDVAMLTPEGKRVTAESALKAGVDWAPDAKLVDAPDGDAPMNLTLRFGELASPGVYTFEITPKDLKGPAEVTLALRSGMQPMAAPTILRGPVKAAPKGEITFEVETEEDGAALDILVTDENAQISVVLPQGLIITQKNATGVGTRWRVTDNPTSLDAPGGMFTISGFFLPDPGIHHVINFPRAPRGLYKVRVESEKGTEVKTAFIATGRLMQASYDIIERAGPTRKAEVRMQIQPIPGPLHVGDSVPVGLEFDGEPVRRQLQFQVRAEYQPSDGSPAVRRMLPMHFGWGMDLVFRSYFQPEREGTLQLMVTASGETVEGNPFRVEAKTQPIAVKPMTAQFLGLWEQAADSNGNAQLDRLDIHHELQVVQPGTYRVRFTVTAPNKASFQAEGMGRLMPGRQRLTVPLSAAKLRTLGSDGPFKVHDVDFEVMEGDTVVDRVSTPGIQMTTTPYRLAQWEK